MPSLKENQLRRVIEISAKFISCTSQQISYQEISDYMLELSEAKFVVFNIHDLNETTCKTVALSGTKDNLKKVVEILGTTIVEKVWKTDLASTTSVKDGRCVILDNIHAVARAVLPEDRLNIIETTCKTGKVVFVNIIKDQGIIGDFILIMDEDKEFKSEDIIELYASQVALLIEKRKAIKENERQKDEYARFFAINLDLFCILDRYGNLINVNNSWERLLGYSTSYSKSQNFLDFIHPEDINKTKEALTKIRFKKEVSSFVNRYRYGDGNYHYIEWIAQPCDNVIYGSGRDITKQYERQQQVESLSFRDFLTGLYNRRYMEDAIRRLDTPRNFPLTVMVVDVNGLKLTNDAFGHEKGDRLIQTVANIIKKICRSDDVIGRVGGDEFLVIIPNADYAAAQKIRKRMVREASNAKEDLLIVSIAVGYAIKTMESQNITDIEKIADKNMYRHKSKYGKLMRNATIEAALRDIFRKDNDEQVHAEKVSFYCGQIAQALGLCESDIEDAQLSGVLHDIGKITIPSEIATNPGELEKEEWEEVKRHPITSYNILKGVDQYAHLAEGVLYHHERVDGAGYPEGLKGSQIPLLSRIIFVADAYEAMISNGPYRKAKTKEEAIIELKKHSGTQFDPAIVDVFVNQVIM